MVIRKLRPECSYPIVSNLGKNCIKTLYPVREYHNTLIKKELNLPHILKKII